MIYFHISWQEYRQEVTVPAKIAGNPVKVIATGAFCDCSIATQATTGVTEDKDALETPHSQEKIVKPTKEEDSVVTDTTKEIVSDSEKVGSVEEVDVDFSDVSEQDILTRKFRNRRLRNGRLQNKRLQNRKFQRK